VRTGLIDVDPDRITIERQLAERIAAALRQAETRAGHLAQKVTHEHLGLCCWRSESPKCTAHRALVAELAAALDAEPVGGR
jgi:hypothetical protein